MALKKSELYTSLWQSCDELRGGMDASQYKTYVLVLLFIKYVSDKYAGQRYAPITIPPGVPPAKQGDYAYLLHIVRSLRSTGKGAQAVERIALEERLAKSRQIKQGMMQELLTGRIRLV